MDKELVKRALNILKTEENEPQILYWLGKGQNNAQIAQKLSSNSTNIHFQRKSIERLLRQGGIPEITFEVYQVVFETVGDPPDWSKWPPTILEEKLPTPEPSQPEHDLSEHQTSEPETEGIPQAPQPNIENDLPASSNLVPAQVPSSSQEPMPSRDHPMFPAGIERNRLAIILGIASIVGFIFLGLTIFRGLNIFTVAPTATEAASVVQSEPVASSTIARTPFPKPTEEIVEALVPTDTRRPTNTPAPTGIPTVTPTSTNTPTETATPTITLTPTPSIILPWGDNFDNGELAPEWKRLASQYTIKFENNNGWLAPLSPDADCLLLSIGDESLKNFSFEMGYGSTLPVWANSNRFVIVIGEKIRVVYHSFGDESWETFSEGEWVNFHTGSDRHPYSRHLKILASGNRYTSLLDGSVQSDIVNPDIEASGPVSLQICRYMQIDYVRIEALP